MPKATPLRNDREELAEAIFTEIVVWHVSVPVRRSRHNYKYRLALVVDGVCVLRYDTKPAKAIISI